MPERRRAPRIRVTADLHAKVKAFLDARVVDISETGALLEVDHPLLPKTVCDLRVAVNGETLALHASVRRCRVAGHDIKEDGQRALVYQAALEFKEEDRPLAERIASHLLPVATAPGSLQIGTDDS